MEKEIKNLTKSVELVAGNTAKILERMDKLETTTLATRDDLKEFRVEVKRFKLETHVNLNDMLTDIKSFKQETRDNFKEINDKLDDSSDTTMSYDKRIEKLENKVFA
jgi:methyl-accepting chemotaxis protein